MEYLPLGDMQEYLTEALPEPEAQTLVSQLVEGLRCMHESGFAHRDLKPAVMSLFKQTDGMLTIS